MKKTLSLVLAMLMLLSVFTVTSFAAETAPVVSGITCTFKGISITWDAVEGAVAYIVYRDDVVIATTNDCEYVDANVSENVTYVYNVGVQAENGTITKSEIGFDIAYVRPYCAHKKTKEIIDYPATVFNTGLKHDYCTTCGKHLPGKVIPRLVPDAPVVNKISNAAYGIKISWDAVDGASYYRIYRRAEGAEKYEIIVNTTKTSFQDKTAKSGVTYKYVVRAKNPSGLSKYVSGNTIKCVDTPKNIVLTNKLNGISVKWNSVENAESYRVYRKAVGDSKWTYLKTVKTNTYLDKDVESGSDYVYTVRAVIGKTYSSYLAGSSIRRLDQVVLNSAKSKKDGVYVDFEPVEGASGYYVYRKVGNGSWTRLGTIRTTRSHTYLDVSAKKGVTYKYTVKAYYNGGSISSVGSYHSGLSCKDVY